MPIPVVELCHYQELRRELRHGQELHPMLDMHLMETCAQCTVHTRCTSRAITNNDVYCPQSTRFRRVMELGQRVRALRHSHSRQ